MTYFNTTHVLGKQLNEYNEKAQSQEDRILRFFLAMYPQKYSASDVWRQCFRQSEAIYATVPLTSVRRAITNLYNSGDLVKTNEQKDGVYGRPEYLWKISTQHLQGDLFR